MAQNDTSETIAIGGGLTFTGTPQPDVEPQTECEQLATSVISLLRRNLPKAALSAALDLVDQIKMDHQL